MKNKTDDKNYIFSDIIENDTEFLPLMSDEDEAKISKENTPDVLPILPLRNTVLFPGVIIPITIGRERSVKLIKDADAGKQSAGSQSKTLTSVDDLAWIYG